MLPTQKEDPAQIAHRLWTGDATLWTGADEAKWLGWLNIVDEQLEQAGTFTALAAAVRERNFSHAVLLGMGGSSLCPEVMRLTFGKIEGYPELLILDSTDPAQVKAVESAINLDTTLFIVASKSGSTLEPNIFKQYFFDLAKDPSRFIAITDPGSKMQHVAESDGFWKIFYGLKTIGGRYSALSDFGMIPAAVMGVDVPRFLASAKLMVERCKLDDPMENPGVALGRALGHHALAGRDKVTLVASPEIGDLGAWLEQLIAESTGKIGRGLIPVDRETLGGPEVYGTDRLFAYERFDPAADEGQDAALELLEDEDQPVVRLAVKDKYDLGQEFFRWEFATAVAGAVIGIHPFDQPDVEASKIETRKLTDEYEAKGSLPAETPIFENDHVALFTNAANASELGQHTSLEEYLRAHVDRLHAGDYFAVLGYVQMNAEHEAALQSLRMTVRDKRKVATCLGFGPRFLHSTGQAYKGGPPSGVFLQVTCDDAKDVAVPGQTYTFGVVKAAQARGDFEVLMERKRRALRVHLKGDLAAGLAMLGKTIAEVA